MTKPVDENGKLSVRIGPVNHVGFTAVYPKWSTGKVIGSLRNKDSLTAESTKQFGNLSFVSS